MLNGKELQVGKSYKSTEGDWYFIRKSDNLEYPFIGSNEEKDEEWHYTSKGLFMIGEQHELDLIITDEEYAESPAEFNAVTKPRHYRLFPELNIEVKDVVALLCNRLGTNGYNGAFIADFAQMLQYLMRFDEKNGKEDLEKANEFLGGMLEKYPDVQQLKGQK